MRSFSLTQLSPRRLLTLVARRLIAIDLGSSHLKVLLAEASFGRIHLLHQQIIDLHQEGLLSAEEIDRHLREVVDTLGNHPVALAIPQHLALSHLIDLPRVGEQDIKTLIAKETHSLSGLSESVIVYDSQPLKPFGKYANPFWVTISREQEIQHQIQRLAEDETTRSYAEITTTANALIAAYLGSQPAMDLAVLADLGSTSTVVSIIYQGQPVYAASFPIGGESFTSAIASLRKCSFEEAEQLKRTQDVFSGPQPLPGFQAVVDLWLHDLTKLLREWEEDNSGLKNPRQPFPILLSGGGAEQPGLVAYLQQQPRCQFQRWPDMKIRGEPLPMTRFAVAYGTVVQSFRQISPPTSLLPAELQIVKRHQKQLMTANWVGFGLVVILFLALVVSSVHKVILANRKKALLAEAETTVFKAQSTERYLQQRELEFGKVQPLVERQIKNIELVHTMQVLQQVREQRDLWFVLLADQESYFAGATFRPATNATVPAGTPDLGWSTNRLPYSNGYIVEVSLPAASGDKMKVMRELVDDFEKEKLFRSVDSLAPSLRNTNLLDAKVLVPERSFTLSLEMMDPEGAKSNAPANPKAPTPPPAPKR